MKMKSKKYWLTKFSAKRFRHPTSGERQIGQVWSFGWHFAQTRWPLQQPKIGPRRGTSLQTGHSNCSRSLSIVSFRNFFSGFWSGSSVTFFRSLFVDPWLETGTVGCWPNGTSRFGAETTAGRSALVTFILGFDAFNWNI